jgi:hypothetical protein
MPQSLSKVIVHIIFSTKNREPWLDAAIRSRVHAYLATICRDLGSEVLRVGGVVESRSHHHDVAANLFPVAVHRRDKETILEMNQES